VSGLGHEPTLFRLGCSIEQGATEARRDDAVALAGQDQDRRLDLADARQRNEALGDHPGGPLVREVALGDFGDATRLVRGARNTTFVLQS
jgi:hypothetical protein